jgi:uncharacterized membrane protein YhaH (DUF805 family)
MEYFIGAYKKYADFTGRARRKEYWMFYLFYIIAYIVLSVMDGFLGFYDAEVGIGMLSSIFALGTLIPSLAIAARRLHDINKSGWWQLILFIPILGALVLLFFLVSKGTDGENRFGSDPLASDLN